MMIWKVPCGGCGAILDEGTGYSGVDRPRPRLPCPACGSLESGGLSESWEENPTETQRQMVPNPMPPRRVWDDDEDEPDLPIRLYYDGMPFAEGVWRAEGDRLGGADDVRYHTARAEALGRAYKAAVERELETVTPGVQWRAQEKNPEGGGGPAEDVVELVVSNLGPIADILQALWALNEGRKWLERRANGHKPHVNDGSAMVFAAQEVFERTGADDLTFSFVAPMRQRHSEHWGPDEGFMVGFRAPESVWVAAVDVHGKVLGVTELGVPGGLSTRWDV